MMQPLSSFMPPVSSFEDDTGDAWPEQTDREEYDEDFYEPEKPSWKNNTNAESYSFSNTDDKLKRANGPSKRVEPPRPEMKHLNSDDDLTALLKEEEDLVNAHRKRVEETMDVVREEMNMLVEADQPGNQLDDYISRLNSILSKKAARILRVTKSLGSVSKTLEGTECPCVIGLLTMIVLHDDICDAACLQKHIAYVDGSTARMLQHVSNHRLVTLLNV